MAFYVEPYHSSMIHLNCIDTIVILSVLIEKHINSLAYRVLHACNISFNPHFLLPPYKTQYKKKQDYP